MAADGGPPPWLRGSRSARWSAGTLRVSAPAGRDPRPIPNLLRAVPESGVPSVALFVQPRPEVRSHRDGGATRTFAATIATGGTRCECQAIAETNRTT